MIKQTNEKHQLFENYSVVLSINTFELRLYLISSNYVFNFTIRGELNMRESTNILGIIYIKK